MNLEQVYTIRVVADYMVGLFSLQGKAKVLDPCFGHGVFINSLLKNTEFLIDGVEIDEKSFSLFEIPNTERCSIKNSVSFDIEDRNDGIGMSSDTRTKYSKMTIEVNKSLAIEPDEYMRIADEIMRGYITDLF